VAGIDPDDADLFVPWVEDFFGGFSGDPAGLEPMANALEGIREYWVGALAERRTDAAPREGDLASHLLQATFDGRALTEAELLDMLTVLVLAGLDTTRATLGYLFRHLATHPEHRRRLVAEPELIPSAVEEALRLYTIVFGDGRKVTRDTEFHGVQLKQGDMVYALVSGANRDPRAYEQADEFVIDRKRNQHMGFANGPHRCLGAHLARRELQIAVQEWLRAIPDFHIATDEELRERGGGAMMTLTSLPLAWEVTS
jgi:cytochrome P450